MSQKVCQPLAGLRVVDFGQYIAGPMAAVLLADQGADVISIDPPGGPRWNHPSAAILQRGKRRIELDFDTDAGVTEGMRLVAGADVVIENFRPGVMDRLGFGYSHVAQRNPHVIYISMPAFSRHDERRDLTGWEGVISAACGLFTDLSPIASAVGLPPIFTALPIPSVYGAIHAAIAAVAGIYGRERNGCGDFIEVPLLDAAMSAAAGFVLRATDQPSRYNEPPLPSALLDRITLRRIPNMVARVIEAGAGTFFPPFFRNYGTADGRKLFVCAIDNTNHINRLLSTLDLDAATKKLGFTRSDVLDIPASTTNIYAYRSHPRWTRLARLIRKRIRPWSAEDVETLLASRGVPAGVQRTTTEWTSMPHMRAASVILATDSGVQPGLQIDVRASTVATQSPGLDSHRCKPGVDWSSSDRPFAIPDDGPVNHSAAEPLSGVTVLDMSNVIAGPVAARTLAELGATVTHVDPVTPTMGPRLLLHLGLEVNQGKKSIALNPTTPDGAAVLERLIESSDVLLYNKTEPQARRLGIAPRDVHSINDQAVVCAITAWGGAQTGEWDDRPGYDPVVQAVTGVMTRFGGARTPAVHGVAATIDYFTGYSGAFAVIVGLLAKRRGARDIVTRTSLVRTAGWIQLPFITGQLVPEPSGTNAPGWHALDRLYRTRDGWIYLAGKASDWPRIRNRLAEQVPRITGSDLGSASRIIEAELRRRPTLDALGLARDVGLAAHRVVDVSQLRRDAHAGRFSGTDLNPNLASGRVLLNEHPSGTSVYLPDNTWNRPLRSRRRRLMPAPYPGDHSRDILYAEGLRLDDLAFGSASPGWPRGSAAYLPD